MHTLTYVYTHTNIYIYIYIYNTYGTCMCKKRQAGMHRVKKGLTQYTHTHLNRIRLFLSPQWKTLSKNRALFSHTTP